LLKDKIIDKSESIVYFILAIGSLLYIAVEIFYLFYILFKELIQVNFTEGKSYALKAVPIFFNILISLEILETFKHDHNLLKKIKIILIIALTAICRKIIIMDIKHTDYFLLIGIATLVICLCLGFYFLSRPKQDV
jgi:uncharacterized membrane protein (DUF373 family)